MLKRKADSFSVAGENTMIFNLQFQESVYFTPWHIRKNIFVPADVWTSPTSTTTHTFSCTQRVSDLSELITGFEMVFCFHPDSQRTDYVERLNIVRSRTPSFTLPLFKWFAGRESADSDQAEASLISLLWKRPEDGFHPVLTERDCLFVRRFLHGKRCQRFVSFRLNLRVQTFISMLLELLI